MLFNQKIYQPASKTRSANVALSIAHTFAGCDTNSAVYRFGETSIFKKFKNSKQLRNITDIFYKDGQYPQTVGTAAMSFFSSFEVLHSSSLSHFLRYVKRNTTI